MKSLHATAFTALAGIAAAAMAQAPAPAGPQPFQTGTPLGVTSDGKFNRMSANVKVFGAIVFGESCSYDPSRNLIVMMNRGAPQTVAPNDGFVSLLHPDGSVHTSRWIGVTRDGLTLNDPLGSDIHGGRLYVADSDGNTADGAPRTAVLRMFDLKTGAPAGEIKVPQAPFFNDVAIARDGTVYATQTGSMDGKTPMRLYRLPPGGQPVVVLEGEPLSLPNGVAVGPDGNVVVVNMGDARVLTLSPQGKLLGTEQSAQTGSDGLVIMPDGTKYVSSVRNGGISRIRPGQPAQLIATGVPSAASMCYDPTANQLVIPMNPNNAVGLLKLE